MHNKSVNVSHKYIYCVTVLLSVYCKPIVLHCKSVDFAPQKSCLRIVKVQLLFFRGIIFIKPRLLFVKQSYIYSEEADEL